MIPDALRHALTVSLEDRVVFDEPLARHTSLRVGGPADAMATPRDRSELQTVLRLCHAHDTPVQVLGAGFNVLVLDSGIRGVVLRLKKLRAIERVAPGALRIEAGASHATITRHCIEHGLEGLEFGAGIPGTLGGWLAMNAGIGSREAKDVVLEIESLENGGRDETRRTRDELDFRYRALEGLPEDAVLVAATLAVEASTREAVQAEVDALLARRQATQPLDVPSCGSVFRNPDGDFAGRLVEAAGLKGLREGGAEISDVHANFIVNRGGATAQDVFRLIERARAAVEAETGVSLEPEVRVLGDAPGTNPEERA